MSSILESLLREDEVPCFAPVGLEILRGNIGDVSKEVDRALDARGVLERVKPGARIAITAGSREIDRMDVIIRQVIVRLRACGAKPFIVPSMGSHGGATAEGQIEVLAGYGIAEERMGAPILSSMEVVPIGATLSGIVVHLDKYAMEADGIVVIGRIKPHTDFRGRVESGLMKMMAIGLGKQHGANICHRLGFENMAQNVWEFGRVILQKAPVLFGLGIIEDGYHRTWRVEAVPAERIPEEEPALLDEARRLMPGIPFEKIDVLIVQEIGKDISGSGMDPNITGRSGVIGRWKPYVKRIAVLDITEKSHGNGAGLGLADATTLRAFRKFDFEMTYPNCITARDTEGVKIPSVLPSDLLAIKYCIHTVTGVEAPRDLKVVWIKNTGYMERFYISPSLLEEAEQSEFLTVLAPCATLPFDASGNANYESIWE